MLTTKLDKTIVQLQGKNLGNFLQGLITQDINLAKITPGGGTSIYSLMLNNKGRYLYDFIIIPTPNNTDLETFLICIDTPLVNQFIEKLNFYTLRYKLQTEITPYNTIAAFNSDHLNPNPPVFSIAQESTGIVGNTNINNHHIIIKDPRLPELGYIIIDKTGTDKVNSSHIMYYNELKYSLAIPSHAELISEKSIPLEVGFDELNAISYNKGCYIGQEFTNSSKRVLAIRKRLITFVAKNFLNHTLIGSHITNINNEKVAKVLGILNTTHNHYIMALARMNLLATTDNNTFRLKDYPVAYKKNSWIIHYNDQ